MRSFVALALIARALALPQSITPNDSDTTTSDDPSSVLLFVKASDFQALCSKMPNERMCKNTQLFTPADLCRSSATGADGDDTFSPLLKLALAKPKSGSGDDNGTAAPAPTADSFGDVLASVKAKLAHGGDSSSTSASPSPTNPAGGTLASLKAALFGGNDDAGSDQDGTPGLLEPCDCENDAPTSTESESGTATLSVSLTATATATGSFQRRDFDTYVASKLASLHVTASRAATSSESASPTGYSRSGSDSGALAVDELFNSFESGSSTSDNDPTETEDALAKRDLKFFSATGFSSVAFTADRTASSTQSASPTGYYSSGSDGSSLSYEELMDSALTEMEESDDMPMYV